MPQIDVQFWVGIGTLIAAIVTIQWTMNRSTRADAKERHQAHERRDSEQQNRLERLDRDVRAFRDQLLEEIKENEAHITELRSELQKDYVRLSELKNFRDEVRKDFDSIFKRSGGISRGLERLIGRVQGHLQEDDGA